MYFSPFPSLFLPPSVDVMFLLTPYLGEAFSEAANAAKRTATDRGRRNLILQLYGIKYNYYFF